MKQNILITVTAAAVCAAPAAAQNQAPPLTLSRAIAVALERQPTLAAATANRQAGEARANQAKARYLPTVTPTYQIQALTNTGTINQILPGGIVQPVTQTRSSTIYQEDLAATYRLFDAGTRDLNARQARQNLRGLTFAEENARQTVIGNVADAYYNALRNDALVKVSEAQVERAKNTFELIKAQIAAGLTAEKDVLQPEADYLNAQVSLLQAQNNAEIARTQLRNAMGITDPLAFTLNDVAAPKPDAPMTATVDGVAITTPSDQALPRLVAKAIDERPDIAQGYANIESNGTTVRLSKIAAGAQYSLDATARYQFDAKRDPLSSIGNNRLINLNVTYPLFDGNNARQGVRAAEAQQRATTAQVENQKQGVVLEVEQAWRNLQQSRAAVPASAAAQNAAQTAYEKAVESKKEGVGSIVEIITAQTQLVQAQTNYVQAVYNFHTADARLARALGQADRLASAK